MKNRIVNNTGVTLPLAFEALIDLLDQYIVDAMDTEDTDVFKETDETDRLADFIYYVAITRNVKLLDIMNQIDTERS